MTGAWAAVAFGLAAALLAGGRGTPQVLRLRLALGHRGATQAAAAPVAGPVAPPGSTPALSRRPAWTTAVVVVAAGLAAVVAGSFAGPAGAVGTAVAFPLIRWLRRRRAREAQRRRRNAAVADACLVIGSELAAGGSAPRAMEAAAREWPDLFGAAAARMAVGSDPVTALRTAADQPGAEAMAAVAAAWQVAEHSGARAAVVLRVVADTIRDEAGVRHEAEAQLSTVRTTARMLAALPPITLVVFSGGIEPVRFLLRNPYGLVCLAGASLLLGLGLAWVGFVRREATRSAWQ